MSNVRFKIHNSFPEWNKTQDCPSSLWQLLAAIYLTGNKDGSRTSFQLLNYTIAQISNCSINFTVCGRKDLAMIEFMTEHRKKNMDAHLSINTPVLTQKCCHVKILSIQYLQDMLQISKTNYYMSRVFLFLHPFRFVEDKSLNTSCLRCPLPLFLSLLTAVKNLSLSSCRFWEVAIR